MRLILPLAMLASPLVSQELSPQGYFMEPCGYLEHVENYPNPYYWHCQRAGWLAESIVPNIASEGPAVDPSGAMSTWTVCPGMQYVGAYTPILAIEDIGTGAWPNPWPIVPQTGPLFFSQGAFSAIDASNALFLLPNSMRPGPSFGSPYFPDVFNFVIDPVPPLLYGHSLAAQWFRLDPFDGTIHLGSAAAVRIML